MESVTVLKAKLSSHGLKGEQKLVLYKSIREQLHRIELAAARDFGFPLSEVREAIRLLPEVDTVINRLSKNKKKQ